MDSGEELAVEVLKALGKAGLEMAGPVRHSLA